MISTKDYFVILFIVIVIFFSSSAFGINTISNFVNKFDDINEKQLTDCNISDYEQQDPWPMFRHDLKHTGRSIYSGPAHPVINWSYMMHDSIISSAAIVKDGTIYVGVGWDKSEPKDPYVYAFKKDGNIKWKFKSDEGFFSSPAIDVNGTIYITGLDGYLYSIEDNEEYATLNWKKYLDYDFNLCSPSIGYDGTIHVGSPSFRYYNIKNDGSIHWSYKTDWCIISSPAIDDTGIVYIGSKDHNLYAFNIKENKIEWNFSTGIFYDGHLVDSSPAIGNDGTIYVGTDPYGAWGQTPKKVNTNFWAINPNGTLKWSFETEDGVESSPAIGNDGVIYFGSYDGYLYSVKDSGNKGILQWKYKTNGPIDSSPVIDGDGIIYVASRDNNLYAIYPNGTTKWIFENNAEFEASPSLGSNGHIYIGDYNGNFYCLGEGGPDVGIESIDTYQYLDNISDIHPKATIRNYRDSVQIFNATCIIMSNQTIYEDTQLVELRGGESKIQNFSLWTINNNTNVEYTMIIFTDLRSDKNSYNDKKIKYLTTSDNLAPLKPARPNGSSSGKTGEEYMYSTITEDPEDDQIWYKWDFGGISTSSWLGPYNSSVPCDIEHKWLIEGEYSIKVKAKDEHGKESAWSDPLEVMMPKTYDKPISRLILKMSERFLFFHSLFLS